MANPNSYDIDDLNKTIKAVREKFRDKLANDKNYFGNDHGVAARVAATLNGDLPIKKLEDLAVRGMDASSTSGIMRTVDLTILKHDATKEAVEEVARRAAKEHCATVCVYPEHVQIVSRIMQEEKVADVLPIAVVGFPSVPAPTPEVTAQTVKETLDAIKDGAKEIDMVLPTSFREDKGDYQDHFNYIKAVVDAAHGKGIPVKVILETAYLSDEQISSASMLSKIAGAEWVKTSTGFAGGKFAEGKNDPDGKGAEQYKGATPHVVALMRCTVGHTTLDDNGNEKPMGVKASGGVRNRDQAVAVLQAGADRIGASGGIDVSTKAEKATASQTPTKNAATGRGGY